MNIAKEWVLKFIEGFSIGKYESVFYSHGTNLHSSIIGGIFTLIFALVFIVLSSLELARVGRKEHFNIDQTAVGIAGLRLDVMKNGSLYLYEE
jgi:ABC-type spermidine/putrescine transport system permease subunit II